MFQIFFTTVFFFFCANVFAAESQTLEEITSELKSKKEAMEPFDSSKIKIDVESLGLDDLDKKPAEKKTEEAKKENLAKPQEKDSQNSEESAAKKPEEDLGFVSKIQNFINKKTSEDASKKTKEKLTTPKKEEEKLTTPKKEEENLVPKIAEKKPTQKYINSLKKKNLKKRLRLEKQKKENEKKRQEKLKKLNELRKKYLIKINKDPDEQNQSDLEEEGDAVIKIVPQRKDINKFATEELPAPPILNRFRTSDNLHIPAIPTFAEKLDVLFESVASGDVNFFNSAYKNIENPDVQNRSGDTILTYSVLLGEHPVIASILAKEANPDLPNALGYTPMDISIELLDIRAIELLANNNANIYHLDAFGRTYLMHAARVGFLPAVDFFISRGVDVNVMDNDGFTALAIAYRHKKEVIVKFLLKSGAKTWIEKPYNPERESLIKELENHWR